MTTVAKKSDGAILLRLADLGGKMRAKQREHLAGGIYPADVVGECTALQEQFDEAVSWVKIHYAHFREELDPADKRASIR